MSKLPRRKFGYSPGLGSGEAPPLTPARLLLMAAVAIVGWGWNQFTDRPPNTADTAGWVDVGDDREWMFKTVTIELFEGWNGDTGWSLDAESTTAGECVPGMFSGSAFLYGSMRGPRPGGPDDLLGRTLAVEFSGDGDDHHLCLPDYPGFLIARDATSVEVTAVDGDLVTLSLGGRFDSLDEHGVRGSIPIRVNADFIARYVR
ncbi:MAG: hypothetical protein GY898_14845 [Proteobacteria bacterium]|nr:hypothetical protein [Pseudomonadota bacterium]